MAQRQVLELRRAELLEAELLEMERLAQGAFLETEQLQAAHQVAELPRAPEPEPERRPALAPRAGSP